uniref:Putative cytochrome P450 n=1 Tax=Helianthus annuus TaxID=4232 RepID=A0A251U946_HELAN
MAATLLAFFFLFIIVCFFLQIHRKKPGTKSITTLFGKCIITCRGDEAKWLRKMMLPYLGPDALSNRYSVTMDVVTRLHIQNHWEGRNEVKVFNTVKLYLFELACPTSNNLPPGSFGWPFLGETLEFIRSQTDGTPERFVRERVERYGSPLVFKTSLLGHPTAIFSGPEGNKFLFGNENKLVAMWLPEAVGRLFGNRCLNTTRGDEAKWLRKTMLPCLGPDALSNRYCIAMDEVTRLHIQSQWEGRSEVTVFDTVKPYLFELACRLFLNLDDPRRVTELGSLFNTFLKGLGSLPIDIPGTQFYRGKRAAIAIKKQLIMIINQRKLTLKQENASSFEDLLSHLLLNSDENGQFLSEMEIANNILLLLFAGHDTSAVSITLLMKCLGEHPDVYKNVLKEQLGILEGKAPGEVLNWEDIQKMRYSWNVVCEVLRLNPPVIGSFREALVDFEYAGYTIPKGWKCTHDTKGRR